MLQNLQVHEFDCYSLLIRTQVASYANCMYIYVQSISRHDETSHVVVYLILTRTVILVQPIAA